MRVDHPSDEDIAQWALLRAALWPDYSTEYHATEVRRALHRTRRQVVAFMCRSETSEVIGFAEASLREDGVNGCETSPVLFLEGIYVRPDQRRRGAARLLCKSVAEWGRFMGYSEFASDALLDNNDSHRFLAALGFKETERVVYFRKQI